MTVASPDDPCRQNPDPPYWLGDGCGKAALLLTMLSLSTLWLAGPLGCTSQQRDDSAGKRQSVFVGIPPLAYLVNRVGDGHVTVEVLVPPGQDPHTFELTPRQMTALSMARAFFKVGIPFEDRLAERIADNPQGPLVFDVTRGVHKRPMDTAEVEHAHHHSTSTEEHLAHGSHGETAGEADGGDPHVWLAPAPLKILAQNVAAALELLDPAHATDFRQNLEQLNKDLDVADAAVAATLKPYRGQTFYVYHPAFGYFADAYGLKQEAVEAAGKAPTPKQLRELIHHALAEHVKIIFVQPQFDPRSAQTVAEAIGGRVVPIDDLASDVLSNFHDLAAKLKRDFGDERAAATEAPDGKDH
jgi:zinc transport system substrate-binding protein